MKIFPFVIKKLAVAVFFCWAVFPFISVHAQEAVLEKFYAKDEKIRITFINPTYEGEPFWSMVTDFMSVAASDLAIDLSVKYSHGNRFQVLTLAKEVLSAPEKPHYLIFVFQAHLGKHLLEMAEQAQVHSFAINTNIPEAEHLGIGEPRELYRYWLGHMFPDERHAGFTLASVLVEQAVARKQFAADGKVHLFALGGAPDSAASSERLEGLHTFLQTQTSVQFNQQVNAAWSQDNAANITKVLLSRYPETSVIWAASDLMSLGALQAAERAGLKAGRTIFSGGVDGTAQGLEAIKNGRMRASLSGHFREGAWALVLLHDHFHGIDFKDELGTTIQSKMNLILSENVADYEAKTNPDQFKYLSFRKFSKKFGAQSALDMFYSPDATGSP